MTRNKVNKCSSGLRRNVYYILSQRVKKGRLSAVWLVCICIMSLRAARLHVDANLLIELLKIVYTLYSPRVATSKIIQIQLQTENIEPINNGIVTTD